ncbi:MAG TPA: formate dehydrogenase accessory sulfurtransferase FdhD [Candidatus Dormibacteraeota bacterium]|nr:formate dehydrogenase accessory sulfurtransferase FdhD [Candidatus Dormibacteraeota bacterium]
MAGAGGASVGGRPRAPAVVTARWSDDGWAEAEDLLAGEEPLQVLLNGRPLTVLMRTPGHDLELALGLLWAEGILHHRHQVRELVISAEAREQEAAVPVRADLIESNQVDVRLSGAGNPARRSFFSSSACGVCGTTAVESLARSFPELPPGPRLEPEFLVELVGRLRSTQPLFERTGGLHAAGLFGTDGRPIVVREDVGRHNAVDKVVGRAFLDGLLPARRQVLVVSGRGGFEIVQKAVAAGIPIVAAVGAPSSLAVATARRFGLTLAGFVRDRRMNVYSGAERLGGRLRS